MGFFGPYGVEFSPSSKVLYILPEGAGVDLFQYDLNAPNTPLSELVIPGFSGYGGALQLGPDGRIYVVKNGQGFLDVVNNPDVVGVGCNYVVDGVSLSGRSILFGLPSFVQSLLKAPPVVDLGNDTSLCQGESLILDATLADATHLWQDGSVDHTFIADDQGTYWVEVTVNCQSDRDTIIITNYSELAIDLGNDTLVCQGDSMVLDGTTTNANYIWQNGSTNPTFNVTEQGTYWVVIIDSNNCSDSDSIMVDFFNCDTTLPCLPISLVFSITTATAGQNDGAVKVNVSGGYPPYLYSLDSITFQNSSTFNELDTGIHQVYVIDSNGCAGQGTFIVDQSVGVGTFYKSNNTKVYPNPFSNELFISISSFTNGNIRLRLVDVLGRVVYSNQLERNLGGTYKINPDAPKGMYFLEIVDSNETHIYKILRT